MASASIDSSFPDHEPYVFAATWVCPTCGNAHRATTLAPGEKARCVRCGTVLNDSSNAGSDASLAFAVTGLIVAVPAFALPFVTVSKLSHERVGVLLSGVSALWEDGMRVMSAWVLLCGALGPLVLLGLLVALLAPLRLGWRETAPRRLVAIAHAVEQWSMPEVHVLAVLVALVKLHTLVGVRIGVGFWCYIALSFATLMAWRAFGSAAANARAAARATR